MRRIILLFAAVALVLSLTACVMEFDNAGSMLTGALKEYKEVVDLSSQQQTTESMEVNMEMQAAKAVIDSTAEKLADVSFSYNSEVLKPEFKVEDDEISITNNIAGHSFGKPVNIWDVKLAEKIPLEVGLKADASEVKLDMGRMLVRSIDAILNASTAKIYFNEPNKTALNKIKLDANASSASIYGARNSGFEVMDIDSDASKLTIDLSGENVRDGEVRINADASTIKLKLPADVGVKIVIDKYEISSVIIDNSDILSRSAKEFVTKNYEETESTLKIYADLNVTTLTLE